MLDQTELLSNIALYDQQYSVGADLRQILLPSKSAILEVCGWTEEAMDQLVIDCAHRCSLPKFKIEDIVTTYIKNTYGFEYKRHFEKMIVSVIGTRVFHEIESNTDPALLGPFQGALSILRPLRNHYAHTHFNPAAPYPRGMTTVPTPSIMRSHALDIAKGLLAIETELIHRGL